MQSERPFFILNPFIRMQVKRGRECYETANVKLDKYIVPTYSESLFIVVRHPRNTLAISVLVFQHKIIVTVCTMRAWENARA